MPAYSTVPAINKSKHAGYIDGLRALAVISVIFYHLNAAFLPGGFTGVDIFFVISGYVVSASVGQLESISFRGLLAFFYARRLFRIFPALIICLLVTGLMLDLFVPFSWLSGTNQKTGLAALLGYGNIILSQTAGDYFSPRVGFNPFTHTWSLGVEEQFYLVFPLLFVWFLNRRRWLSVVLMVVAGIASLFWAMRMSELAPQQSFYLVTTRFWELAAGALLFQVAALAGRTFDSRLMPQRLAAILGWIFLFILLAGLIFVQPDSTPFPGGVLPVVGTIGLLICFSGQTDPAILQRMFAWAPARFMGKISYSLYLWHWPIFVAARWTCGLDGGLTDGVALALTFVVSVVSFYLVETPTRNWLRSKRWPQIAFVGLGLASVGVGYGLMSVLWWLQPELSLSTVVKHAPDWYPDAALTPVDGFEACQVTHKSTRIGGGTDIVEMRSGCALPTTFSHKLFVIGDSHAAAYDVMLRTFALTTGATVNVYGMGGCSFIGLLSPSPKICEAFTDAAIADVKHKMEPGDILFLPSLRVPRIVDEYIFYGEQAAETQMFSPQTVQIRAASVESALPLLRDLTAKGLKVVFEGPTPEFGEPLFRCADWFDRGNSICRQGDRIDRNFMVHLRAPVIAAYQTFQQIPGVSVWDPFPILCPPGIACDAYHHGRPVIFDGDHLSGYANRLLEPNFEDFLIQESAIRVKH